MYKPMFINQSCRIVITKYVYLMLYTDYLITVKYCADIFNLEIVKTSNFGI